MESPSLRFIFDRKNETKSDATKKALVQIEVYDKTTRKKVYISTGVRLTKNQFSPNGGMSVKNHPNASILKANAHDVYNKVEAFARSKECTSIEAVKNWNKRSESYYVVDFMKEELRKSNPSSSTLGHHNTLIKRIEEFGKIKTFEDIN